MMMDFWSGVMYMSVRLFTGGDALGLFPADRIDDADRCIQRVQYKQRGLGLRPALSWQGKDST